MPLALSRFLKAVMVWARKSAAICERPYCRLLNSVSGLRASLGMGDCSRFCENAVLFNWIIIYPEIGPVGAACCAH